MSKDMSLWEAIRERRSFGKVTGDPVDRATIEQLLEAANWAPSHRCTEPWRFFVMTGDGRQILADAYADIADRPEAAEEERQAVRTKQAAKAFRAPVVIAAAVSPAEDPNVIRIEEFAAAHAAVQNLLLAAHALGLAAIWRSGEPCYHPRMKQAFGLSESEELVGLIYLGYPDGAQPAGKRRPTADKTVWLT
jgi:nitroreductase